MDQFHYLGDLGLFEGRRAMLINGVIVEEGPMNPPHRISLEWTCETLRSAFGPGWRVCMQMPLVLGQSTDPKPDVALVAESSLRSDTTVKVAVYAAGLIPEYGVVDVKARQGLVFRDPQPDPTGNATYLGRQIHGPADAVVPSAGPGQAVRVADLLP